MKQALFNRAGSYFINRSLKYQRKSSLKDLGLWSLSVSKKGKIEVNTKGVEELVSIFGSPLMVVNRSRLLEDARSIQKAIKLTGEDSRVVYSYKTNCVPGILNEIHESGIGAEVVSPYELWLAERLNVPGEKIVYNGVNKTRESIERAISLGILSVNIDSLEEIERIVNVARHLKKKARVGIRLGFIPKAQFGLDIKSGEAMEACRRIKQHGEWLDLTMVHFCVTSNARNSGTHQYFAKKALAFIHAIREQTGIVIRYLNIGGGIGVPTSKNMSGSEYGLYRLFGCLPKPPNPNDFEKIHIFMSRISETLREVSVELGIQQPAIVTEPGRFITSRAEFLLCKVLAVKKKSDGPKFAITDVGRLSVSFPCDFEYHEIFLCDQRRQSKQELYHVMGRICTSADWLAKNILLPELREGDILAIMDAGAYFSSYSTNFAFPRPPIAMVTEDGNVQLIRDAESFEHLVALDAAL